MFSSHPFVFGVGSLFVTILVALFAGRILETEFGFIFSQCYRDKRDMSYNWKNFRANIRNEIFGQDIATDAVFKLIYAHVEDSNPKKALVLSFHGWLGSGKTHLSQLIAETLFSGGIKNPNVHTFIGPTNFLPDPAKKHENQRILRKAIEKAGKSCSRALFIFDEVDKMPNEIFDALVPFIDHYGPIEGVDYRGFIFIFLSNSGGEEINKFTAESYKIKLPRRSLNLNSFRKLITDGAFIEKGGLEKADMISKRLIDHYIPFLPLEKIHVELCVKREMKRRNVLFISPKEIVDKMTYWPDKKDVYFKDIVETFSIEGCKNVHSYVNYYVHEREEILQLNPI